jgi:hypothetical protein
VDDFQACTTSLPIIEEALARYSSQRRRGFKNGKVPPRS